MTTGRINQVAWSDTILRRGSQSLADKPANRTTQCWAEPSRGTNGRSDSPTSADVLIVPRKATPRGRAPMLWAPSMGEMLTHRSARRRPPIGDSNAQSWPRITPTQANLLCEARVLGFRTHAPPVQAARWGTTPPTPAVQPPIPAQLDGRIQSHCEPDALRARSVIALPIG